MADDPYLILGVSRNATKDDIRKAYRRKAKEYHPDLHPNDPMATKKMNEINEAYDTLMNPEKHAAKQAHQNGQQQNSGGYKGPGGWASDFGGFNFEDLFGFGANNSNAGANSGPRVEIGDSPEIRKAVTDINNRRYQAALDTLFHIPSTGRNARWHYLNGVANHHLGNTIQALDHMQKAVQLDHDNRTYQQLLYQYRQSGRTYEHNARGFNMNSHEMSKVCCATFAAPLCCGSFGFMPCYI